MSEVRDDKVLADLRSLRKRLSELENSWAAREKDLRTSLVAVALAVGMFALTAATWATEEVDDGEVAYTLWGLPAEGGWFAVVTLALVVVTCLSTIVMFAGQPLSRVGHIVLVVLSIAAGVGALLVGTVTPEDTGSGPGRWLTVLGMVFLIGLHGDRAGSLRYQ